MPEPDEGFMPEPDGWPPPGAQVTSERASMSTWWKVIVPRYGIDPRSMGSGQATAGWVTGQLPGCDPETTGWGLIAVAASFFPLKAGPQGDRVVEPDGWPPGRGHGAGFGALLAARAGEALVLAGHRSPAPAPLPPVLDVGSQLAAIDVPAMIAEAGGSLNYAADDENLGADIGDYVRGQVPGADLRAVGWAAVASAVLVAQTMANLAGKKSGLRRRPLLTDAQQSGMFSVVTALGTFGDYLKDQPGPG